MAIKHRYYKNLKTAAQIMEMSKETLSVELNNLSPKQTIQTDTHSLHLVDIKQSEAGKLYYVKIIQNNKCVFNAPVLLGALKRIKLD